jgi:hypothetical protein
MIFDPRQSPNVPASAQPAMLAMETAVDASPMADPVSVPDFFGEHGLSGQRRLGGFDFRHERRKRQSHQ